MKIKVYKSEIMNSVQSSAVSAEETALLGEQGCVVPPVDYSFLAEILHENSWHERCLKVKSRVVAGLGYSLKNEKVPNEIAEIIKKPSKGIGFVTMLNNLELDFQIFGNAYIEVVRIGNNVEALYHMPARDIRIKADRSGYVQIPNGIMSKSVEFKNFGAKDDKRNIHELIHLKNYSPSSSYYGLPDYLGCVPAITTLTLIAEYNIRYFANGCMADLAIIVEGGDLDEETENKIIEKLKTDITGLINSHRTLFLSVNNKEVKIRIEKLNDVKDGSFKILKDSSRDEIVSAHGVPPRLAGIVVNGSLGGTNESRGQMETFLEIDIKPRQARLVEVLNQSYEEMYGVNPDFYLYELDIMSYGEKITAMSTGVNAGIITVDEARDEIGYQPMGNNNLTKELVNIRKQYLEQI